MGSGRARSNRGLSQPVCNHKSGVFAEGLATHDDLRSANGSFIQSMDEELLIKELVSHSPTTRVPIVDEIAPGKNDSSHSQIGFDDLGRRRTADPVTSLQDPSGFDRSSLRRIPAEQLNELLNQFESLMDGIAEDSSSWRQVIQQFRQDVPSQVGLSHIRVILTIRGPSFASVLWLLVRTDVGIAGKSQNLHH